MFLLACWAGHDVSLWQVLCGATTIWRMAFNTKQDLEHVFQFVVAKILQKLAQVHVGLPLSVRVKHKFLEPFNLSLGLDITVWDHFIFSARNWLPVPTPENAIKFLCLFFLSLYTHYTWFPRKTESCQTQLAGQRENIPTFSFTKNMVHVEPFPAEMCRCVFNWFCSNILGTGNGEVLSSIVPDPFHNTQQTYVSCGKRVQTVCTVCFVTLQSHTAQNDKLAKKEGLGMKLVSYLS